MRDYIAHRRKDGVEQTLLEHLEEVGNIASALASKFGSGDAGKVVGFLHDFGKLSEEFQDYIGSATGKIGPADERFVDFDGLKGRIDHATAGAQIIWDFCSRYGKDGQLIGQLLALCIASHHGGLIDCLKQDGENGFKKRIEQPDEKTHKAECINKVPFPLQEKLDAFLNIDLLKSIALDINKLSGLEGAKKIPKIRAFYKGLWVRMLFSCLIDSDRISSADFEKPENRAWRNKKTDWSIVVERFEGALKELKGSRPIDKLRRDISNECRARAKDPRGIYTLTVPTGGGKTYSSLRYALHHAHHHRLDHIIYVIPYTSIIEQNAQAIREMVEHPDDAAPWVLEHHSNLEPEKETWHGKLASENWDAPIIMTTMVQFLEVLFSGGTRSARRMHQLANSLVIFDEIQTLPVKCTHLFCNALNFLSGYCKTTVLLCTATQPLLNELKTPAKGQLHIPPGNELIKNAPKLFEKLRRVNVVSMRKTAGWAKGEIADLALRELHAKGSSLIIVNTKSWARTLYDALKANVDSDALFHLSTYLCPAHRKEILTVIKKRLDDELPVLCISTQLIEAGVDISFASVIRFFAGLDSIAQAAGRCNRHGEGDRADVFVVNPESESIDFLEDIKAGRDKAIRVFDEGFDDLLAPDAIRQYFKYYFHDRADVMAYPIKDKFNGLDTSLLDLLSDNESNTGRNSNAHLLQQSFKTAGRYFKSIDSPTQAVIVPYNSEGTAVIAELCAIAKEFDVERYRRLLRKAQKYSVNLFPNDWKRLLAEGAVHEVQQGEGLFYLDERYYDDQYGLSFLPVSSMTINIA